MIPARTLHRNRPPTARVLKPSPNTGLKELAPNAAIPEIEPLGSLRATATAPQRYQFTLLMTFASLALMLAAIGV